MGSIENTLRREPLSLRSAIRCTMFLLPIFISCSFCFAQSALSLSTEIIRLERLSSPSGAGNAATWERYNAFLSLARLHRLSGNPEAALKAYEGVLALFPNDGRALLEQGRLLVSLGEYEKAAGAAAALLNKDGENPVKGRYLLAQIEAFRSGNTRLLETLVREPAFADYRCEIYYTLWRLTDNPVWMTRLISEFPGSPEAKIASGISPGALSTPTPLWLLWPGRESVRLLSSSPAAPLPPASLPPAPSPPGTVLQTGLFAQEENAVALSERLKRAGFESRIQKRHVNGADRWVVTVPAGGDTNDLINAMMKKLKDSGFDSFPVR